jgi:hypothetical protein
MPQLERPCGIVEMLGPDGEHVVKTITCSRFDPVTRPPGSKNQNFINAGVHTIMGAILIS